VVISSVVSRASASVLLVAGLALLFAADATLSALVPGIPPAGAWLGGLLAAAWLGVAALNWLSRSTLLGGIYGRAIVSANAVLYFVSAATLTSALRRLSVPGIVWGVAGGMWLFAIVYGALLFRGPFDALTESGRG
jgi:hypothetical protein